MSVGELSSRHKALEVSIDINHEKISRICLAALFAALSCAATMLIQIPMPATGGYINLGDCMVLLGAFLLGPVYGMAAGGIGSMLADVLLGYASYAPCTLIVKGLMALAASLVFVKLRSRGSWAILAAGILGEIIMVFGYFGWESLIMGYGLSAAASIPGNSIQGLVGMVLAIVCYKLLSAVPSVKRLCY